MHVCVQCEAKGTIIEQKALFCVNCYHKLQQAEYFRQQAAEMVHNRLANQVNYLSESMEYTVGLRATPPTLRTQQLINQNFHNALSYNKINIDGSTVGILNTGQIKDIENINININTISNSGYSNVANALKILVEIVISNREIEEEQKTEILELLNELSCQTALLPNQRAKRSVLKAILLTLDQSMTIVSSLHQVWLKRGTPIKTYLGF